MSEYESKLETRSVGSLVNDLQDTDTNIDLNPLYQRDVVWNSDKQSKFIESVMLGIIPMNCTFNINKNNNDDSDEMKITCIDGKQRLTSLKRFYNNEIYVEIDGVRYFFNKKPSNLEYDAEEFNSMQRSIFKNAQIPVSIYQNLSFDQEIELFSRLQNGMATSCGERITSQITDKILCKSFNELCGMISSKINKFAKEDRKENCILVAQLLYIVSNNSFGSLTNTKVKDFIKKMFTKENDKKIKELTKNLSNAVNNIFTDDLLNDPYISYSINRNVLLMTFFKIFKKYSNNFKSLTSKEKLYLKWTIKNVHNVTKKKNIGSGMTEKKITSISEIFDKSLEQYRKKSKVDVSDTDISTDCSSNNSSDSSDSEDIVKKKKSTNHSKKSNKIK